MERSGHRQVSLRTKLRRQAKRKWQTKVRDTRRTSIRNKQRRKGNLEGAKEGMRGLGAERRRKDGWVRGWEAGYWEGYWEGTWVIEAWASEHSECWDGDGLGVDEEWIHSDCGDGKEGWQVVVTVAAGMAATSEEDWLEEPLLCYDTGSYRPTAAVRQVILWTPVWAHYHHLNLHVPLESLPCWIIFCCLLVLYEYSLSFFFQSYTKDNW